MSIFGAIGATRADPASITPPPTQQNAPLITAARLPPQPRRNPVVLSGQASGAGYGVDSTFSGKLSLGFLASIVVLLVFAYMWTRNVQGGG